MLANRGLIPAKDQLKHRCKLLEAEWQKIKKDISRKKDCSLTTRLNNISFVKLQKQSTSKDTQNARIIKTLYNSCGLTQSQSSFKIVRQSNKEMKQNNPTKQKPKLKITKLSYKQQQTSSSSKLKIVNSMTVHNDLTERSLNRQQQIEDIISSQYYSSQPVATET